MIIHQYPSASVEEIESLKKLVRSTAIHVRVAPARENIIENKQEPSKSHKPKPNLDLFEGGIATVEITRDALQVDNPVQWLLLLRPDFAPYKWQFEELMRIAGYLQHGRYEPADKTVISDQNPYLAAYPCANGSGKDMVLIAAAATWFAIKHSRNRVIITSSSFEQIKFQTEPAIRDLISRANRKFGVLFKSTQFHHVVPELGSEIKLFATDEAGKAEGFHPFADGEMMIIINEAKSVTESISDSLSRCTGYSHRLEISSPGPRSGFMFKHASNAIHYPEPARLGQYYCRRVSAYECPHLSKKHIDMMAYEKGADSPWFRSSVLAEFFDIDTTVVISSYEYEQCLKSPPKEFGDDIGIGLDLAAGGDEDACFVRVGNKIVHQFFFQNHDTDLAVQIINTQLAPWKNKEYSFRADNGGIGLAMIDKLIELGWHVMRTNNQSPANNKKEFLNLGAQQWFHLKRLIGRKDIIIPNIPKLQEQITTRWYRGFDSTQGKLALESKAEAKLAGRHSPDRADAFVLCFASYYPDSSKEVKKPDDGKKWVSNIELLRLAHTGELFRGYKKPSIGRSTLLNGKI